MKIHRVKKNQGFSFENLNQAYLFLVKFIKFQKIS